MADTRITGFRVDPAAVDAVRERHGLTDANFSTVVRYALALAGGLDPARAATAARLRPGRRPSRPREARAA